jgi:hypothetical protein
MTNGVTATITARISASLAEAPPLGSAGQTVNESVTIQLNPGTGAGNSDKMFTKAINIAASGNTTVNLTTALDEFGVALALADVQALMLEADAGNVNNIVVGNGSNPWVGPFDAGADTKAVKPGGVWLDADKTGWPVVASTGDIIKLTNSGGTTAVTGKLTIIGRSA